MPNDRERILQFGMDDYIAKPVEYDELEALIRQVASRLKGSESTH